MMAHTADMLRCPSVAHCHSRLRAAALLRAFSRGCLRIAACLCEGTDTARLLQALRAVARLAVGLRGPLLVGVQLADLAVAMLLASTRAAAQAETVLAIRARAGILGTTLAEVPMRAAVMDSRSATALAGALLAAYISLMSGLVRSLCLCAECSAVA